MSLKDENCDFELLLKEAVGLFGVEYVDFTNKMEIFNMFNIKFTSVKNEIEKQFEEILLNDIDREESEQESERDEEIDLYGEMSSDDSLLTKPACDVLNMLKK